MQKVLLEISQNSRACARVSFFNKVAGPGLGLQLY